MMIRAFLFVLGLLLGACCAPTPPPTIKAAPAPELSGPTLAASLRAMTVGIVEVDEDGAHPVCSGVWVAPQIIATARHCNAGASGARVAYVVERDVFDGSATARASDEIAPRSAFVAAFDESHDVLLLRTYDAPAHPSAAVRVGVVEQGSRALAMGHPRGLWWSFSAGEVAAVRVLSIDDERRLTMVQTTATISMGSSGGGLFDERGALLGIAHGQAGHGLNLFIYAAHVGALLDLLRSSGAAR